MVKILEKDFLQALQKNSYWGIGTSLRKKWMGGILDLWVSRCNMEQGLELCVHGSRIWREMWVTDLHGAVVENEYTWHRRMYL